MSQNLRKGAHKDVISDNNLIFEKYGLFRTKIGYFGQKWGLRAKKGSDRQLPLQIDVLSKDTPGNFTNRKVLFLPFLMCFRGIYGDLSVFTGVSRLHFWIPDLAWVRQKRRPKAGDAQAFGLRFCRTHAESGIQK